MKKILQVVGSAMGAHWICFGAGELDTVIGCLCFAFGVILFAGSWISILKDEKKKKKKEQKS